MVLAGVLLHVIVAIFGGASGIPAAREAEAIPWLREADTIPWSRESDDAPRMNEVTVDVPATREAEPEPRAEIPRTREAELDVPTTRE